MKVYEYPPVAVGRKIREWNGDQWFVVYIDYIDSDGVEKIGLWNERGARWSLSIEDFYLRIKSGGFRYED